MAKTNYTEFFKPGRINHKVVGFDFDQNQFENLIDCWTPYDQIPVILDTSITKLNEFCFELYNMDYKDTYSRLTGLCDAYARKTIKTLAGMGNTSALNIMAKHFMQLDEQKQKDAINITIVNDLEKKNNDR